MRCEYRTCRNHSLDPVRRSFCVGHDQALRDAGFIPGKVAYGFRWDPQALCDVLPMRRVSRPAPGRRISEELAPWYLSTLWSKFSVGPRLRPIYIEIGLPDDVADTWAVHFGLHPADVWPEWFDVARSCSTARERSLA